jgi:hypothetical protein
MTLEFSRGDANRPWRWMLAVDAAIAVLAFLYQIFFHVPLLEYSQYLTTYHFGFARRALVGSIIALFTDHVPISLVYILGTIIWLVTLALFLVAFRKTFGFTQKTFALFVFVVGSPFFFKNFMISLGYFDIYGCAWALVALLIGTGPFYPLIIALGCVALILIHHLHFLLYVPTIAFIVALRYGLRPELSASKVAYGLCLAALLIAVFVVAALFGRMPVPLETYLAYVSARATRPINPEAAHLWYATLPQEMALTRMVFVHNALRFPVYAALIALHLPVARYIGKLIAALPARLLRIAAVAGLVGITAAYVAIFVVIFDYSRWVSNWAVCMFVCMMALKLVSPGTAAGEDASLRPDDKTNRILGWIAAAIPRVGITIPF